MMEKVDIAAAIREALPDGWKLLPGPVDYHFWPRREAGVWTRKCDVLIQHGDVNCIVCVCVVNSIGEMKASGPGGIAEKVRTAIADMGPWLERHPGNTRCSDRSCVCHLAKAFGKPA